MVNTTSDMSKKRKDDIHMYNNIYLQVLFVVCSSSCNKTSIIISISSADWAVVVVAVVVVVV